MKKIEHATAAKVCAERDGTTVVIVGRVPDVERARDMIEDLLAKNGIDFRGKPGRGFPLDRRGRRDGSARDGGPNNPGGDLRGLLKRKSLDAEQPAPKAKKGPAAAQDPAWMAEELGKMRARAERFGLPAPTMDDVRAKLASDGDDKKTRAGGGEGGGVDKGDASADEDLVPVADKMMMSRVIGKKRQTMAMLCKIADVKIFIAQKDMAVRVKCADSNRRAHAVALVRAVVSNEIGTKITFQILSAAFDAIVAGEPIPAPDPANEIAAKSKDAAKGGVMARLQGGVDEDEDGDDDDEGEGDEGDAKDVAGRFRRTVDTRGLVGAIIGKNGSTIKRLERVTRTRMEVDQDTKSVTVHSKTEKGVERGCELVETLLASCEKSKSDRSEGKQPPLLKDIITGAIARWNGEKGEAPAEVSPEGTEVKETVETPPDAAAEDPAGASVESDEAEKPAAEKPAEENAEENAEADAKQEDAQEAEEEEKKPATRGGRGRGRGAAKGGRGRGRGRGRGKK